MYRYGDGTPFPLDENFIETLTTAVETCTNAFLPLAELDTRRDRARDTRKGGERETAKLDSLQTDVLAALAPHVGDKKTVTGQLADKLGATVRATIADSRKQVEQRVAATEALAAGRTAADGVVKALAPFFEAHQLPKAVWIVSWDARGVAVAADAVATSGRLAAAFSLAIDSVSAPIRVDTLAEAVVVHMMKKGMFGKAKPAPIDLGKYVLVAYERTANERVLTLKESATKASPGLRFAVSDAGDSAATWVSITAAGDTEGDTNPLDVDDLAAVRRLADGATKALDDLKAKRRLVDLTLGSTPVADLAEPRMLPFELLAQLTPLARSIRERSRASGELVLKRDIGDGRREELFVPRATLAAQFAQLPDEYCKPFEDMGISGEETSPAIMLPPRAPARSTSPPPTQSEGDDDLETNEFNS